MSHDNNFLEQSLSDQIAESSTDDKTPNNETSENAPAPAQADKKRKLKPLHLAIVTAMGVAFIWSAIEPAPSKKPAKIPTAQQSVPAEAKPEPGTQMQLAGADEQQLPASQPNSPVADIIGDLPPGQPEPAADNNAGQNQIKLNSSAGSIQLSDSAFDIASIAEIDIGRTEKVETGDIAMNSGSTITSADIDSIRTEMNSISSASDSKFKMYDRNYFDLSAKVEALEAVVAKKKYDLGFEKDRPEITGLIIGNPSRCNGCVPHASWVYQGVRIQKQHDAEWNGFRVQISDNQVSLSREKVKYDYWQDTTH